MNGDTITRTAPIARGHLARFTFEPDCGLLVEMFPAPPRLRSKAERRRFLAVYAAARTNFLDEVSASTGASIDVSETCGEMEWIASS